MSQLENMSLSETEASEQEEQPPELQDTDTSCKETLDQNQNVYDPQMTVSEESPKESKHKQAYEAFLNELSELSDTESKLQKALSFLEASLAQGSTPHFKTFWDTRQVCLDLFRQNISPQLRSACWNKYTELSKEARRLKEMIEEQNAFAAEQIEIAINALEKEIEQTQNFISNCSATFLTNSKSLEKKFSYYQGIQGELNLLNAQASRINALRKELIKTEMRIRQKNKFFQQLSQAGDKVFPRRKELIKDVSRHFIEDVDSFIEENFSKDNFYDSLFFLREEIKAIQGMAKLLTLNTHSFNHTRLRLSECWDKVKSYEKDRKKVRAQQRVIFKQNQESVSKMIRELMEAFSSQKMSIVDALRKIDEITTYMRQVELGKDELKILREELSKAKQPIFDQQKKEEQEKFNQEQERERQKKQRIADLWAECRNLLENVDVYDADKILAEKEAILERINQAQIPKLEKQDMERFLRPLKDVIAEKKEKALLALSEDDRQKLEHLKELLSEKKERWQEIKSQLNVYRKAKGASGLDFEQAMNNSQMIEAEKERLEKITLSIKELEEMIEKIGGLD